MEPAGVLALQEGPWADDMEAVVAVACSNSDVETSVGTSTQPSCKVSMDAVTIRDNTGGFYEVSHNRWILDPGLVWYAPWPPLGQDLRLTKTSGTLVLLGGSHVLSVRRLKWRGKRWWRMLKPGV